MQCNRLSGYRTADVPADRPPQSRHPAILPRSGFDDMQFDRLKRRASPLYLLITHAGSPHAKNRFTHLHPAGSSRAAGFGGAGKHFQ